MRNVDSLDLEHEQSNEKYEDLANELDALQSRENEGRGISCVKNIIAYLHSGKTDEAKAICHTDGDKISSYPKIVEVLKAKLFDETEANP